MVLCFCRGLRTCLLEANTQAEIISTLLVCADQIVKCYNSESCIEGWPEAGFLPEICFFGEAPAETRTGKPHCGGLQLSHLLSWDPQPGTCNEIPAGGKGLLCAATQLWAPWGGEELGADWAQTVHRKAMRQGGPCRCRQEVACWVSPSPLLCASAPRSPFLHFTPLKKTVF